MGDEAFEEQVVAEQAEEVSATRVVQRRKERVKVIRESLLIALLACVILVAGFWFTQSGSVDQKQQALERSIETLFEAMSKESKKSDEEAPPPKPTVRTFLGLTVTPDWSLEAVFEAKRDSDTIISVTITVETPEPPALTDLELVQDVERAPWIQTITMEHLKIRNKTTGFLASGAAKIFVNQRGENERVVADGVVTGQFDKEMNIIDARILINKGFADLPKGTRYIMKHEDGILTRLYISGKVKAEPLGEK